jgi:hypothetical protein
MGILKLYELRREEKMRQARDWFFGFNPSSAEEISAVFFGPHSAHYRMVTSYRDMAASFVNGGAIDERMFNDTTSEHVMVFAKGSAVRRGGACEVGRAAVPRAPRTTRLAPAEGRGADGAHARDRTRRGKTTSRPAGGWCGGATHVSQSARHLPAARRVGGPRISRPSTRAGVVCPDPPKMALVRASRRCSMTPRRLRVRSKV